jgi:hypothetical protein
VRACVRAAGSRRAYRLLTLELEALDHLLQTLDRRRVLRALGSLAGHLRRSAFD